MDDRVNHEVSGVRATATLDVVRLMLISGVPTQKLQIAPTARPASASWTRRRRLSRPGEEYRRA